MKEISNQFFMDLDSNGIVQILKYWRLWLFRSRCSALWHLESCKLDDDSEEYAAYIFSVEFGHRTFLRNHSFCQQHDGCHNPEHYSVSSEVVDMPSWTWSTRKDQREVALQVRVDVAVTLQISVLEIRNCGFAERIFMI
jgi:hypothetical protein